MPKLLLINLQRGIFGIGLLLIEAVSKVIHLLRVIVRISVIEDLRGAH